MSMVADTCGAPLVYWQMVRKLLHREKAMYVVAAIDLLPHIKYTELHHLSPC